MVKAPKDVNAPKKPLTPYMTFSANNRDRIVKTMPEGTAFGDVAKKIGEEWAKVSDKKKEAMDKTYKTGQAKWQKKFDAYKKTAAYEKHQELKKEFKDKEAKKQNKFRKDDNAPKRPPSGYFCFMAAKRDSVKDDNPDLGHKELLSKMGEMWSNLSEAQKKPHEKEAAKAKATYEKAVEKYQKSAQYKAYQKEKKEHMDNLKSSAKKVKAPKSTPKREKSPKPGKGKNAKKAKTSGKKAKKAK